LEIFRSARVVFCVVDLRIVFFGQFSDRFGGARMEKEESSYRIGGSGSDQISSSVFMALCSFF
jgi:hypothetical protein